MGRPVFEGRLIIEVLWLTLNLNFMQRALHKINVLFFSLICKQDRITSLFVGAEGSSYRTSLTARSYIAMRISKSYDK